MNLKYTVHSAVISRSVEEVTFSGGILHLHSATGKSLRNGITAPLGWLFDNLGNEQITPEEAAAT